MRNGLAQARRLTRRSNGPSTKWRALGAQQCRSERVSLRLLELPPEEPFGILALWLPWETAVFPWRQRQWFPQQAVGLGPRTPLKLQALTHPLPVGRVDLGPRWPRQVVTHVQPVRPWMSRWGRMHQCPPAC